MTRKKILFSGLGVIFIAGLIFRLICVFSWGSLMFDELVSLAIVGKPLGELGTYLKLEMHPVVHFYYLHFWVKLWGGTGAAIRLSSLVISFFCLPGIYFLGKEMFNSRRAGLVASFLFSFSAYFIFYSVMGRMYVLLALFTILSFYFFLKILKKSRPGFKLHSAYTLTTLIAYHTHLTTALIIPVQLAYIFLIKPEKVKRFFWDWLIVVILYLPWFVFFLSHKFAGLNSQAWYFGSVDYGKISLYPFKFVIIGSGIIPQTMFQILAGVVLALFLYRVYKDRRRIKFQKLILPALILVISFSFLTFTGLTVMRYFIIPGLGMILILAYLISRFNYKAWTSLVMISLFLVLFINSLGSVLRYRSTEWQEGINYINQNPNRAEAIILAHDNHYLAFDYYYKGDLPVVSVRAGEKQDRLFQILENCVYPATKEENLEKLKQINKNYDKIFLVLKTKNFENSQRETKNWFLENDWEIKGGQEPKFLEIYLLEK